VDVVGGGLAGLAARPDWIATADLTLHLLPRPVDGAIEAHGRVLRAGRTTVVVAVGLATERGERVGVATMSFAVLPRRDGNPVLDQADTVQRMTMEGGTPLDRPVLERVGLRAVEPAAGVVELPYSDYVRNTLGAVQGGMMATAADVAAEHALTAACGGPVDTTDLQITYLALAKVGPVRSRTRVLTAHPAYGIAHVELEDAGAGGRVTTLARVVAVRPS
jgi:acyl-coenzyme A thioesterase PaaI-like protein